MEYIGPNLRSLHIPNLSDAQAHSLRHCTDLEELIYDGPISEAILHQLPNTLDHLQVQPGRDALTETAIRTYNIKAQLTRYIERSILVTFTWVHDCGLTHKEFRVVCEKYGIEFRLWLQPYGTYPGERPELGEVDSFPQRLSLSPTRFKEMAAAKNGSLD
ncbi:hypothetical protein M422DRAFT_274165 [Sphaerobolus stellatus SS14]|uniref:Uncharacterized protein n=1 Tax=Sphaerobolus stellatus (strain SS14) TaxID=990650 RepID=A0A0C9UID5_SPHS4|nr:hypothetical protein M422DRAFT_274165 [Sphaerobolus stellatus SS14]